jgi:putative DNA primase/helicase
MVILSANEPPESSDRTSGQERRKLTIGLDNRIPEYEGRDLTQEFRQYLPGLLKRVLEIPRERVTALIKYTDKNVPALARKKWAQLIETNPIAAWVDDCIVINPDAKSYIGKDDPDQAARWLYANFCKYQRESGHRSVPPVKRFSSNLRDLLKNQMKVPIQEGRDRNGAYIQGVGLRCFYDPEGDKQRPLTMDDCDGFKENCDGLVTDETLTSVGCDGCDGFLLVEPSQEEIEIPTSEKITESYEGESEQNPSPSSHPAPASIPAVTNPSPNPSQPTAAPNNELQGWEEYHQMKPYPNPKSDNVRSSQKRALAICQAYRAARTKEDLSALQREKGGDFSQDELVWVYNWLKKVFKAEYNHVQTTAKISQPGLL